MTKKSHRKKPSRRATAPGGLIDIPDIPEEVLPSKFNTKTSEKKLAGEPAVRIPKPKFENSLLRYPRSILSRILSHMDYLDFYTLPQISRKLRYGLDAGEAREVILEKFLGDVGYRSESSSDSLYATRSNAQGRYRQTLGAARSSAMSSNFNRLRPCRSSTSSFSSTSSSLHALPITLKDLHAYYTGLEFGPEEMPELAERLRTQGLDLPTFRMIRASTRAYNKLLIRIRSQPDFSLQADQLDRPRTYHLGKRLLPIYAPGKPAVLKVWVPSLDTEMSRDELVECERELWKSEVRPYMRKGDVCWNTAMGSTENQGRVLFDGRCLQDLDITWDPVGHLPSWLNMFMFPPSFYHHVITSSTTTPVFFLDLTEFKDQIQATMNLCQDKFNVPSHQPQDTRRTSMYRVQRWVYRSVINILPATKTGNVEGMREWDTTDSGVGTIHRDWVGKIVIEVDGTAEKARDLIHRCTKASIKKIIPLDQMSTYRFASKEKQAALRMELRKSQLSPWKIIRERSRPGHLWIQALYYPDDGNFIE
ncbi:hypothetical protein CROQUDRAFT_724184 [Cronartium quercuum f. sp. fusiforme G11]|uniref:F-box domain-containing protein n=1 Tax=Cronartium quercuum f. sp. fusiforme G11 TaxID=708437 RepID=A0A9P6NDE3_9BASI|nr:hypothetical protein CROQUDRAFT_724184 [Cronartium quercuum f. sp. fusiforme G11]